MHVHTRGLNKGETLACSKKALVSGLPTNLLDWISLASIGRHFELEERIWKDPKVEGIVILSATVSQVEETNAYVLLYIIPEERWSKHLSEQFVSTVLPKVARWIVATLEIPETGSHWQEKIIVAWTEAEFKLVQLERKAVH